MADRIRVSDLDFVYISYAEPNKELNWADLKNKVPWAKRVDGVKGFDSAHKAAAETAETDFFISVDGDNIIDESLIIESNTFSLIHCCTYSSTTKALSPSVILSPNPETTSSI